MTSTCFVHWICTANCRPRPNSPLNPAYPEYTHTPQTRTWSVCYPSPQRPAICPHDVPCPSWTTAANARSSPSSLSSASFALLAFCWGSFWFLSAISSSDPQTRAHSQWTLSSPLSLWIPWTFSAMCYLLFAHSKKYFFLTNIIKYLFKCIPLIQIEESSIGE